MIVSIDKKAIHLASQVGIPTMDKIETTKPAGKIYKPSPDFEVEDTVKQKAKAKSLTLKEILAKRGAKPASEMRSTDPKEPIPQIALMQGSPNRRLFLFFLGLCLTALIIVAYFVLPKATVAIELESKVEKIADRITLADADLHAAELGIKGTKMVPTRPVSVEKELIKTYTSTGIASSGTNAQGILTIVNDAGNSQPLIAATRFRTPDGIIFRIQAPITVPARSSVTALVLADPVDEAGKIVGDRGNIQPGTKLSIPGLQGANRDLIYGKNDQAFTGGVTKTDKVVTQADIDASKTDIIESLRASAAEDLKTELASLRDKGGAPLFLLDSNEFLGVSTISMDVIDGIKSGDKADKFRVQAKVRVEGIAYDKAAVKKILDMKVAEVIHPDQRIASQDDANMRIDIVEPRDSREERQGRIKANATLSYRFEYVLSEELILSMKKHILGEGVEDSQRYIQSLEQVGQSEISTWPFWVRRIPGIVSSVEVVAVDSIDED